MTGAPEQVPAMIEARRRGAIGAHLTEVRTAPSEDNLNGQCRPSHAQAR